MAEARPDDVAIVGIGCIFPAAPDTTTFWRNIHDGVDAISDVPPGRWDPVFFDPEATGPDRLYCRRGGFVDELATFDPARFGIMPVAVEGTEPDQLLALATAAAALADAGNPQHEVAPDRVGVVIGRGGYLTPGAARLAQRTTTAQQLVEALRSLLPDLDEARLDAIRAEFQTRLGPVHPESSIGLVPNLAASRIANRLDLQGPAYTVDAACASALVAVDQAVSLLASQRCDLVLAGGVHHCHDLTIWSVFSQLRALSPSSTIRPFSRDADGILIGEGTGLFALERLADAERRGHRVYAVVKGTGVASDGRATSLMSPRPAGQVLAIRQAWKRAAIDPGMLGLIEAHGTATPAGDGAEISSLRTVFDEHLAGGVVGLGSVKSMIGHAMPAAGAAGLAKAALAIHHGELPPTLHAADPHPDLAGSAFRILDAVAPWEPDHDRVAGVNAFGFGGINAHVVLAEHRVGPRGRRRPATTTSAFTTTDDGPAAATQGEPVLLLAGADARAVSARLEAYATNATDATPLPAIGSGPARLAIVGPNPKRLELARKVVGRGAAFHGRNDVWFDPAGAIGAGGKVVFLYPGVEPEFDPHLDDVAAALGEPAPIATNGAFSLEHQGLGIVGVGLLLDAALARLGIRPDLVAGHSLGEWTAQIAVGMTPRHAADDFLAGVRPGAVEVPDAVFLALGCGVARAEELIAGIAEIGVSHDNCPHQSVVCGTPNAAAAVLERAATAKVLAQELPFRSGFHSPFFAPYLASLRTQLGGLPIHRPTVPLWSATTGAPYPDDEQAVRELAVRHLLEPVRFRQLVENLHDAGARVFVQIGLGTLGAFVDDTLRDREAVTVVTASARHHGFAQLRRAAAAIWVQGGTVDLAALGAIAGAALADPTEALPVPGVQPTATGVRLDLGVHLVRDLTPLPQGFRTPTPLGVAHPDPLQAELDALLVEAAQAAEAVAEQWATRRVGATASHVPAPPSIALPPPTVSASTGPERIKYEREVSLAYEPRWRDHSFYFYPDDWPDVSDRFPLVPMTGILEILAETANELAPGRHPVALSDIRAFNWLSVEPPRTVQLSATALPDPGPAGELLAKASIEGHARAVVHLGADYPRAPQPRPLALTDPQPPLVSAERLYEDRWLFHGPEYQGVAAITDFGSDGICGVLRATAAPGALLDNAGQLLGHWVAAVVPSNRLVLPTSIDRISFYGPHPEAGTEVHCDVHVTTIGPRIVRADLELTVADRVWCRIDGWEDRRFDTDEAIFRVLRRPERNVVSEVRVGDPYVALTFERWPEPASRFIVMWRYLRAVERARYEGLNPRAQRHHLLGRIAVKDAVRRLAWDAGAGELYPAEVVVTNDDLGAPHVSLPDGRTLHVSIAHVNGVGAAAASANGPVGIDVELVEPRTASFAAATFTPEELALPRPVGDDDARWLTRLWAAKEAAAKAGGTGLGGRPADWPISAAATGTDTDTETIFTVAGQRVHTELVQAPAPPSETDPSNPDPSTGIPDAGDPKEYVLAWTDPNP